LLYEGEDGVSSVEKSRGEKGSEKEGRRGKERESELTRDRLVLFLPLSSSVKRVEAVCLVVHRDCRIEVRRVLNLRRWKSWREGENLSFALGRGKKKERELTSSGSVLKERERAVVGSLIFSRSEFEDGMYAWEGIYRRGGMAKANKVSITGGGGGLGVKLSLQLKVFLGKVENLTLEASDFGVYKGTMEGDKGQ